MSHYLHAFILALGLILPLGVQNLFVFNQGVTQPALWRALPAVITAAICDTLLILLAVQGLSMVLGTWVLGKMILQFLGGCFLLYMGVLTWRQGDHTDNAHPPEPFSTRRQITFAAGVSLLNPHAILDTIGVIGTSALQYEGWQRMEFALVCVLVSWLWFIFLATAGSWIKNLNWGSFNLDFSRFSAVLIWFSACFIFFQFSQSL